MKENGGFLRSRSYYRHHRFRSITRKKELVKWCGAWSRESTKTDGHLAKGKVHCGCGRCVKKVKDFGWKISDKRKLCQVEYGDPE